MVDEPELQPAADEEPIPITRGLPKRARGRSKRSPGTPPTDEAALALARRAVELAADKKASDIVLLEIGDLTTVADYFVICSGASERQLGAIVDGIAAGLREEGTRPIGREGSLDGALDADRLRLGRRPCHGAARARVLPARAAVGRRAAAAAPPVIVPGAWI